MKVDNYLLSYILNKDPILQQLCEMLSFFKLVDKSIFKEYIVDVKICTRRTLDKKLKLMEEYGLIEISKSKIRAKRKLLEKYHSNLPRIEAKRDIDIKYNTKAFLTFYSLLNSYNASFWILKDEDFRQLYTRKIYKIDYCNYVIGRIYAESPSSFKKRLVNLLDKLENHPTPLRRDISIYIPLEYNIKHEKMLDYYKGFYDATMDITFYYY